MEIHWEPGAEISVKIEGGAVVLSANAAGLRSLAGIMETLAKGAKGAHIHLDKDNSLEDDSEELIIEKADTKCPEE